jgi:hypothetical protein
MEIAFKLPHVLCLVLNAVDLHALHVPLLFKLVVELAYALQEPLWFWVHAIHVHQAWGIAIIVHRQRFALNAIQVFMLMERMPALPVALDVWSVQALQYAVNVYHF